jgi:hypothetical protein
MTSIRSITISAATALVLGAAMIGSASAQNQPSQQGPGSSNGMMGYGFMGMMGPGMMGSGIMGPGMMGYGGAGAGSAAWGPTMCSAMAGHMEGRLAFIKAELKITSAQETLWSAYADAARGKASTMLARCATMMSRRDTKVSLPERLDQNEQFMAAQLDAVRATNKALKPLYDSLSDSQKQTADQMFWGMGMMGGMM